MARLFDALSDLVDNIRNPMPDTVHNDARRGTISQETQDYFGLSGNQHAVFLDGWRGADIRNSISNGEVPKPKLWWSNR